MSLLAKQPPRILIVDDEPANLKVMRQVLQDHYRLSFARSGQDALALLEQESVDLVLLDIMMPEMTGFDVCEQLKAKRRDGSDSGHFCYRFARYH
ncbi:MAG: response regulator [Vibrio fluvialis]